jgi:luciferase family oxidoreductase group 1
MKLSIVDVSPVAPDETRHDALKNSIRLAQKAEEWGYTRIWYAEHHGGKFIAGRAPEVLISAVAANTKTIRVGSGSVLLNHYSPYKVAEVFCTLNELYPGRIDLGAGRATTGPVSDFALQQERERQVQADSNQQILELVHWLDDSFPADHPFSKAPIHTLIHKPELYLLGSSSWSASAAAQLGLRYVFAGFINQPGAAQIIQSYRNNFKPGKAPSGIKKPEVILSVHVVCADTEEEARKQLAPVTIMYQNLSAGRLDIDLPMPDEAVKQLGYLPEIEKYKAGSFVLPKFIAGNSESVKRQLKNLAEDFGLEEIIIQDMLIDFKARLRSYELISEAFKL